MGKCIEAARCTVPCARYAREARHIGVDKQRKEPGTGARWKVVARTMHEDTGCSRTAIQAAMQLARQ
jgi:hypothetical protein